MPPVVLVDGVQVEPALAVVSIRDRGFLYGDTVFETLRAYRGRARRLTAHLARLGRSAGAVGLTLPVPSEALEREVASAVAASGQQDAVVRVTLSRGEGPRGIDPRSARVPRRFVVVDPLVPGPPASAGVRVVTSRRGTDLAPSAKIGAYVDAILAMQIAHASGDDDAVLVDASGHLLEATTANVFVVTRDGQLATPPAERVFPGLTRAEVLVHAKHLGLSWAERPLRREELDEAAEAFTTSTVREIVAVVRVDGRLVGGGQPGPVTAALRSAYAAATLADP